MVAGKAYSIRGRNVKQLRCDTSFWKKNLVITTYGHIVGSKVPNTIISHYGVKDWLAWTCPLLCQERLPKVGINKWLRKILEKKILDNVIWCTTSMKDGDFFWRLHSNALPTCVVLNEKYI